MTRTLCGDCDWFIEEVGRHFGDFVDRHGFKAVECAADRGGRECSALFEAPECRLLFFHSDGSSNCALGAASAPFPGVSGFDLDGASGWFHVLSLVEFLTGKKLLTRRQIDDFLDGKRDYFAWQAELLRQSAPAIFDLLRQDKQEWRRAFADYVAARG